MLFQFVRKERAKLPKFPLGISERNFDHVEKLIAEIEYDGPFALSCDDTKLHRAFRPYIDKESNSFMIIGCSGERQEIAVPSMEALENVIRSRELTKATKVRVWLLQAEVPKMPPILVAVMAIVDELDAEERTYMSVAVLEGLIKRKIKVISCSHDRTSVERRTQALINERFMHSRLKYTISDPSGGDNPAVSLDITVIHGQPLVMVQDSKHALKTYRNNLSSGARALVAGNQLMLFRHIADMVNQGGPVYPRDVFNSDRQDDNAATRFFSSDSVEWYVDKAETQQELRGMVVYLFVFGDLVNAFQNREIPHIERAQMALRAKFFMQYWLQFLDTMSYPRHKYCISKDAIDITRMLVEGLIGLIVIHRDYCEKKSPLLPWLHSSETCKHFFGEARKLVSDFTYGDLFNMLPKLRLKLRLAATRGRITDGKERANGYNHTYFNAGNAKFSVLCSYPTDKELEMAAMRARSEAQEMFFLLGVAPAQLSNPIVSLPGIESFITSTDHRAPSEYDSDEEENDSQYDEEEESNAFLLDLLEEEEIRQSKPDAPFRSFATREALKSLSYAAVSMNLEETRHM